MQLATKFGVKYDSGTRTIRGDPEYVRSSCEASLKRLDVDYIDLYYQHRVDPKVPIEITVSVKGVQTDRYTSSQYASDQRILLPTSVITNPSRLEYFVSANLTFESAIDSFNID